MVTEHPDPWPLLKARYLLVLTLFAQNFPDDTPPEFPARGDPNEAIMVIDQMLAKLEKREPLRIRTGPPVKAYDPKDEPDATS